VIRSRGGTAAEVTRAYVGILAVALAFVLMALLVQPSDRAVQTSAAGGPAPSATGTGPGATVPIDPATGVPVTAAPGVAPGRPPAGTAAPGACADRTAQVPGDPYSPPCVAFSGANGGATSRGVTDDEIVVAVRELEGPTAGELFADLSGQPVISSKEAIRDTYTALAEYFSSRFQLYGRKIRLVFYGGQGNGSSELLGAGQEKALADAVKVSKEIKAFADISAISTPYADALSRQAVVNIGAPYPPQPWYLDRRPYAWSLFPDGTTVVDSIATWAKARILADPIVHFAGPEYNGKKRVYGVVGPENPEYESSGDRFGAQLGKDNIKAGITYRLDISSMPNQASNIIAQLKDAGVTTVICACDPVMLALGLAPKANEQDYHPEWVTGGLAFVDQDIVAQLIDAKQWSRAFGLAFNAEPEPLGHSFPRAAFRAMRPTSQPAFGVEELYYQMYILALGLQGAGPNLTPQTFEAGMFAYPGGAGPRGGWHFGPGDYTATDDYREIWWDPNRVSAQNGSAGSWAQLRAGARYTSAAPPSGPAPFFEEG
jgi:hypothetical protein